MLESIMDKDAMRVTPLLVNLYDTHRVYELAKDKRAPARSELTGIVLELLNEELSPREVELVTDVLIGLMQQAEEDLRRALAETLADRDNVPLRLILHMANDEISIAGRVLKDSPVLGELDLIYIIKSQGPDYWRAVALRKILSDKVIDLLADTEEPVTAKNLIENKNINLTPHSMEVIAGMTLENETLAGPLLARDEIPREIAFRLYRYAGEQLKVEICERFEVDEGEIEKVIDKAVSGLSVSDSSSWLPSVGQLDAARTAFDHGRLGVPDMIDVLRRGDITEFVAGFSVFSKLDPEMVVEILSRRYGQGLAVACKGLNIEKSDFLTMYFLTQKVRKSSRIANRYDIAQALAFYERTGRENAVILLENSRK